VTWHPVYVGIEFLFLSYKWIVFLVQVYLFFALGPHAFRFLCPRARGFAGPGAGQWWGWRGVAEGLYRGARHAHRHFREPFPGAWDQDRADNDPGGAVANWAILAITALERSRTDPIGAVVRRLERRWHTLGVRLRTSSWAVGFRSYFRNATERRSWAPSLFRWWAGDTRPRPDLNPFYDWPCDRPGTLRWSPPV